jgi:hypothetical protein
MPYLRLPDDSFLEVPKGVSKAEALAKAKDKFPKLFADTSKAEEGFIPSLRSGARNLVSQYATGFAPALGLDDETVRRMNEKDEARRMEISKAPSFEDVKKGFREQGLFGGDKPEERGGISQLLGMWRGQLAESAPQIAATIGGARIGATLGAPLGVPGVIGGGILGALAPSIPAFAGSNVQRQLEEQEKAGVTKPIEYGRAYAAAVPQAGVDVAENMFVLGKLGFGKNLVENLAKMTGKQADAALVKTAEQNIYWATTKGGAKGLAVEMPTEIAQQILERAQARLPVFDEEAKKEYLATAVGVAGPGAVFGGAGGASARSGARQRLNELQGQARTEDLTRQEALDKKAQAAREAQQAEVQQAPYAVGAQGRLFEGEASAVPVNKTQEQLISEMKQAESAGNTQVASQLRNDLNRLFQQEEQAGQVSTEQQDAEAAAKAQQAELSRRAAVEPTNVFAEFEQKFNEINAQIVDASERDDMGALTALEKKQNELDKQQEEFKALVEKLETTPVTELDKLNKKLKKAQLNKDGQEILRLMPQITKLRSKMPAQGDLLAGVPLVGETSSERNAREIEEQSPYGALQQTTPPKVDTSAHLEQLEDIKEDKLQKARDVFNQQRGQRVEGAQTESAIGKAEKVVNEAPLEGILLSKGAALAETSKRRGMLTTLDTHIQDGQLTPPLQNMLGLKLAEPLDINNPEHAPVALGRIKERIATLEDQRKNVFPNKELVVEGNLTSAGRQLVGVESQLKILRDLETRAADVAANAEFEGAVTRRPVQKIENAPVVANKSAEARTNAINTFSENVDSLALGEATVKGTGQLPQRTVRNAVDAIKDVSDNVVKEVNAQRSINNERSLTPDEEKVIRKDINKKLGGVLRSVQPTDVLRLPKQKKQFDELEQQIMDARQRGASQEELNALYAQQKEISRKQGKLTPQKTLAEDAQPAQLQAYLDDLVKTHTPVKNKTTYGKAPLSLARPSEKNVTEAATQAEESLGKLRGYVNTKIDAALLNRNLDAETRSALEQSKQMFEDGRGTQEMLAEVNRVADSARNTGKADLNTLRTEMSRATEAITDTTGQQDLFGGETATMSGRYKIAEQQVKRKKQEREERKAAIKKQRDERKAAKKKTEELAIVRQVKKEFKDKENKDIERAAKEKLDRQQALVDETQAEIDKLVAELNAFVNEQRGDQDAQLNSLNASQQKASKEDVAEYKKTLAKNKQNIKKLKQDLAIFTDYLKEVKVEYATSTVKFRQLKKRVDSLAQRMQEYKAVEKTNESLHDKILSDLRKGGFSPVQTRTVTSKIVAVKRTGPLRKQILAIGKQIRELGAKLGLSPKDSNVVTPPNFTQPTTKEGRATNAERINLITQRSDLHQQATGRIVSEQVELHAEEKQRLENEYLKKIKPLQKALNNLDKSKYRKKAAELRQRMQDLTKDYSAAIGTEAFTKGSVESRVAEQKTVEAAEDMKQDALRRVAVNKYSQALDALEKLNAKLAVKKMSVGMRDRLTTEQQAAQAKVAETKAVAEKYGATTVGIAGRAKSLAAVAKATAGVRQDASTSGIKREYKDQLFTKKQLEKRAELTGVNDNLVSREALYDFDVAGAVGEYQKDLTDFREATAADKGVDLKQAQGVVDRVKKALPANIKFVYAPTFNEAPAEFKTAFLASGLESAKGAVLPDGTIVVIGENHKNTTDLEETIAHELIGHYGVDQILGEKGVQNIVDRLFAKGNAHVAEVAKGLGVFSDVESALAALGPNSTPDIKRVIVREMIAHAAEGKRVAPSVAGKIKEFLRDMIGAVRNWFRNAGMSEMAKRDTKEIQALVRESSRALANNRLGVYVSPDGNAVFRGAKAAKPDWMSQADYDMSERVIAKDAGFIDTIKGNVLGLTGIAQFVDRYAPVKAALKIGVAQSKISDLEATQAVYYLSAFDKLMNFTRQVVANGPLTLTTKKEGKQQFAMIETKGDKDAPTLIKMFSALGESGLNEIQNGRFFTMYLAAQRVKNEGVGVESLNYGVDENNKPILTAAKLASFEKSIAAQPQVKAAFEKARAIYNKYNEGLVDFNVAAGVFSKELAAELKAKKDYIPFYRQMADGGIRLFIGGERAPLIIGNVKDRPDLEKLVGGDKPIIDIFTSSVQNTHMMTHMGLQNLAMSNTVDTMRKLGMLETTPKGAVKIGPTRKGVTALQFKIDGQEVGAIVNTAGTIYEDIPAEIVVKGLEGVKTTFPKALEFLSIPATFLRNAVVLSPLYPVRQIVRDSFSVRATAGADFMPIITPVKNMAKAFAGKSEEIALFEKQGLVGGQVLASEGTQGMATILRGITKGETTLSSAMAWLEGKSMMADASVRVAAYNSYRQQGLNEMEAWVATNEILDFNKRGISPSIYFANSLIPFFSTQIQSINVLIRAMTGNMPFEERLKIKEKFYKRAIGMAAFTMMYAMAMEDDEAYKNATPEQKYSNFFIRTPFFDEPLRVPIPFEFGLLFKAIPEAILHIAMGKEDTAPIVKAITGMAVNSIPGASNYFVPQALKPIVEGVTGKDMFTGADVETSKMQKLDPSERYKENTTELSKFLGGMGIPGMSPVKIDQFIKGVGSQTLLSAISLTDVLFNADKPPSAEMKTSQLPFVGGAFQPTDAGGIINRVYDRMEEIDQKTNTFKKLQDDGREAEADAYLREHGKLLDLEREPRAFRKEMSDIKEAEDEIKTDRSMSPYEKRNKLDELRQYKIKTATEYRDLLRSAA